MLKENFGVSRSELDAAQQAADKIRKQRARTKALIPLQKLEDLVESATRKAKRMGMIVGGGNGKQQQQQTAMGWATKSNNMPRSSSAGCLRYYQPNGGLFTTPKVDNTTHD